jgi:hypothetical protein
MTSLADLFNPTFLMFLGILVLVVALLVVYFESKMREQNHKIASMLSLVSTLAEDMNGIKMGVNHLAIIGGNSFQPPNISIKENLGNSDKNKLIEVSDDEESDEEDEEESDEEDEEESDEEDEEEDEEEDDEEDEEESKSSEDEEDHVKVIKLQVSNEDIEDVNSYEETENFNFEPHEDLDEFNMNDEIPEITDAYVEEILNLKYDEKQEDKTHLQEIKIPHTSELKTISINLGDESHDDSIDYKKLQLQKLRSIAIEKGLATNSEASKLKKPELLKLLGAE